MKGRKIKVPNIIKKHIKIPHRDEIGTQPAFNTTKPVEIKKPPLPKNKDLFYTSKRSARSGAKQTRPSNKGKNTRKHSSIKLLEAHNNIDITSNAYKRQEKMKGFRNMLKNIR